MNQPSDNSISELAQAHKQAVIATLVAMASLIVYFNAMEVTQRTLASFNGFLIISGIEVIRIIVLILAIGEIIAVWFMRSSLLKNPFRQVKPFLFQRVPFSEPIQRLYVASIISSLLSSAVGIYGFVLFYLDGKTLEYYPFAAISLLMFLIYWPRFTQWKTWLEKNQQI